MRHTGVTVATYRCLSSHLHMFQPQDADATLWFASSCVCNPSNAASSAPLADGDST